MAGVIARDSESKSLDLFGQVSILCQERSCIIIYVRTSPKRSNGAINGVSFPTVD
jgi:hypothetical protein